MSHDVNCPECGRSWCDVCGLELNDAQAQEGVCGEYHRGVRDAEAGADVGRRRYPAPSSPSGSTVQAPASGTADVRNSPPLWWDGIHFYGDTGSSTSPSVDSPGEGRYTVTFFDGGHWSYQENADDLPSWAVRVELPVVEVPDE
jgi:hypothetical protein